MTKQEVLQAIHVGSRVAEDEQQYLKRYFIQTNEYKQLVKDSIDIIYGAKGTGKSAIYLHLIESKSLFLQSGILIIQAENERGASAFNSVVEDPPTSEIAFRNIWKLYFTVLLYNEVDKLYGYNRELRRIGKLLRISGLLNRNRSLIEYFTDTYAYIKHSMPNAIETSISIDQNTGMISGFAGKICFSNPGQEASRQGLVNIDDLISELDRLLVRKQKIAWIVLDRLDAVFEANKLLEENAIRGLFKAYLDLKKYTNIRQKIFLRTDIWNKITKKGFREGSHITRDITISWSKESILNLVVKRFIENAEIKSFYEIDKEAILKGYEEQERLFYRIFPEQIERGPRKSNTLNWIIFRTADAKGTITPREIIHLIIELINMQNASLLMGKDGTERENLFDRSLFKGSLELVSKVKMEQTIFSEYSELKDLITRFSEQKASNSLASIKKILGVPKDEVSETLQQLQDIGFIRKTETDGSTYYEIPFIYRPYLKSIQGKSE